MVAIRQVVFMGGQHVGVLGLLSLRALGYKVLSAVCYTPDVADTSMAYDVPVCSSVKEDFFINTLHQADILVSVHGRELVSNQLLALPALGGINVHPYLYAYKGASPVRRAIEDKNWKASVGVHRMTDQLDGGDVIHEIRVDITEARVEQDVYRQLYPCYIMALVKSLNDLNRLGKGK